MVLQQPSQRHRVAPSSTRIDAHRILGISTTLALNVLALLALLIPMQLPAPMALPDPDPEITWIEPRPPLTPPPPPRVDVVRPQTPPQPARRTQAVTPPVVDQVIVDQGTLQTDPPLDQAPADNAPPSIAPAGPVQGMRLEYAKASAPPYPREALRDGLQGTVMLQILVDADGRPLQVDVHRSSGHRALDQAAVRHVLRHWTFRPAMQHGHAVQAIGIVPIDFRLDRM